MNNKENFDLSQDADITEVLGMEEKMKEMENILSNDVSDSFINTNKKVTELNVFSRNQFLSRLHYIKQNSMAEIYVIYY
jgi:hypothetical protein